MKLHNIFICASCGSKKAIVIDSRKYPTGAIYRRKECEDCGYRWSTFEISSDDFYTLMENEPEEITEKAVQEKTIKIPESFNKLIKEEDTAELTPYEETKKRFELRKAKSETMKRYEEVKKHFELRHQQEAVNQ